MIMFEGDETRHTVYIQCNSLRDYQRYQVHVMEDVDDEDNQSIEITGSYRTEKDVADYLKLWIRNRQRRH